MPTVTILDDYQQVALSSADWSAVQQRYTVRTVSEHVADTDELVRLLADSAVVVAMRERTEFGPALFARLPELRLLVTTGMRNAAIDLAAAAEHKVTVCGTTSVGNAVPELTIGVLIALARNLVQEDAGMRAGGWQHTVGMELRGKSLGVVGLGRLGVPVADLARALGMTVLAWSPNLTPARAAAHHAWAVSKRELFANSDAITIHMPLSERSRGLVGAEELALMKPTAYLINTSRGPIVDEAALVEALAAGRIAGAGLDVYDQEPLPADHPLRALRNTVLLPHVGYVTAETYRHWFAEAVEDILAWTAGTPVRALGAN